MKEYEILFIVKPHLGDDQYQDLSDKFVSWVKDNGGDIIFIKPMGLRELGPTFGRHLQGYYIQSHFKATPKTLTEIKNRFAVTETVIRHLIVTLDSIQSSKPRVEKPKREKAEAQPQEA
ncbi:MAG: 30S ribosomal protein S6 [Candidatus Margulisiibacteriota bacterium]